MRIVPRMSDHDQRQYWQKPARITNSSTFQRQFDSEENAAVWEK